MLWCQGEFHRHFKAVWKDSDGEFACGEAFEQIALRFMTSLSTLGRTIIIVSVDDVDAFILGDYAAN